MSGGNSSGGDTAEEKLFAGNVCGVGSSGIGCNNISVVNTVANSCNISVNNSSNNINNNNSSNSNTNNNSNSGLSGATTNITSLHNCSSTTQATNSNANSGLSASLSLSLSSSSSSSSTSSTSSLSSGGSPGGATGSGSITTSTTNCIGSVCATVAFMDIKSASKAHTAEHKFDDRILTTEYYEPCSIPSIAVVASGLMTSSSGAGTVVAAVVSAASVGSNSPNSIGGAINCTIPLSGTVQNASSGVSVPIPQYSSMTTTGSTKFGTSHG